MVSNYVHVPCSEGDTDEAPSLADQMRGLEFEAWLTMMEHIFDNVLLYLKAVQVHIIMTKERGTKKMCMYTCTYPSNDLYFFAKLVCVSLIGITESDSWCV